MIRSLACIVASIGVSLASPREDLLKATQQGAPAEQQAAIAFLVGNMPKSDLAKLTPDYLRANVAQAYQARNEFPWGKDIPEDIFFNDVLPYASLDEARDDWRAGFLERFRKHVAGCKTASEALVKLNAAIAKELGVDYNTKRRAANQGPKESIESKMASCSGLSILLVDALRSVGIPARIAGTAMWTTKQGNHNWVEVWLPEAKRWQFTEYYPDKEGLDHGWLISEAARAIPGSVVHGVYATSWKPTGKHFPMVWDMESKQVHAVDITQRYIDLGAATLPALGECELRIDAMNGDKRLALPVLVMQGDVKVAEGTTPSPTDDMNRFFTVKVKQGQVYQIATSANDAHAVMVEVGKDEATKAVRLKKKS